MIAEHEDSTKSSTARCSAGLERPEALSDLASQRLGDLSDSRGEGAAGPGERLPTGARGGVSLDFLADDSLDPTRSPKRSSACSPHATS